VLAVNGVDALVMSGASTSSMGPTSARSTQVLKAWLTPRPMSPPKRGFSG
jgi:hypothetical protein